MNADFERPAGSHLGWRKVILAFCAILVVITAAGILNPSEARHLKEIRSVTVLRMKGSSVLAQEFVSHASYNNYFVFSTITLEDIRMSYGFLGVVKTTRGIERVIREIEEIERSQKSTNQSPTGVSESN